jgi:hypothetical protein
MIVISKLAATDLRSQQRRFWSVPIISFRFLLLDFSLWLHRAPGQDKVPEQRLQPGRELGDAGGRKVSPQDIEWTT